nr:CPBP family intramembrane metalloprotease [Saprospiraceae bacterium]
MNGKHNGFFQAPYRGKNNYWRYLVVLLAVMVGYFIGQLPLGIAALLQMNSGKEGVSIDEFQKTADFSVLGLDANLGLFLLLLSFAGALIFLCAATKLFHRRPWQTLISYSGRLNWRKIGFGFSAWLFLCIVVESYSYFSDPEIYEFHFAGMQFVILLVIAFFVLPLQTSFEELFFRGWMMQGLGFMSGSKIVALLISTALFAGIHSLNPEVKTYGYAPMMMYYFQAGLFLGLLTALDDSLDLALGVHFATNFYAAVFFNYEAAALQTHSLFTSEEPLNVMGVNLSFLIIAVIFIFFCKHLYKWNFNSLFRPVGTPSDRLLDTDNEED